jgi:hypothetical protein
MEQEEVEKIVFQNSDFKFNAAYNTYSKVFDESDDPEKRQGLNELIMKLSENEISYPDFYNEIAETYSGDQKSYRFHRTRIEGSRKFAYRKSQQKTDRMKRHKR